MKNFSQKGNTMDMTAPAGGVTSGFPVLIGGLIVVPVADADVGETFAGLACGVGEFAKVAAQAWTQGDVVYWDVSEAEFTKTASGNYKAGVAAQDVGADVELGLVRLDGVSTIVEA